MMNSRFFAKKQHTLFIREDHMKGLEKNIFTIRRVVLLVAVLTLLVCETSFAASGGAVGKPSLKPEYGGVLRIGDSSLGDSIGYPPRCVRSKSIRQAALAVETLLRYDKTGKPAPWLAAGFKEDAKAKTVTLTIRKGVKFHDGTDLNAEAVKWNLDQCITEKTQGTAKFASVDVINPYTVRLNLTEWDSTASGNLTQNVGMMVSAAACQKNGVQWCANNPVGTGPFQFVSWEKDVRAVYKKFPGYWQKGKPYLDGIEIHSIVDSVTRSMAFKTGELDLLLLQPIKDLAAMRKEGYAVTVRNVGSGTLALIPDAKNPNSPFSNLKVRQAVSCAIDTKAMTDGLFNGEADTANQLVYKGHWGYNQSVTGYPYNPSKAKQLLKEAGYPNGFKTKLLYIAISAQAELIWTSVQGYLKAVGIDVELDPAQPGRFDKAVVGGGTWEGLTQTVPPANPDITAILAERHLGTGKYFTQQLVPLDFSAAVQKAVTAPDFKTKQRWTQEAIKLMTDKYCILNFLLKEPVSAVAKKNVHSHGFIEFADETRWTPEDAWVEKK
jgi:peptide/nickel transport system substrate-binding protein